MLENYQINEQPSLSLRQISQLKELNWLEQQYNLILLGPPAVGKTLIHLLKTKEYIRKSQTLLKRVYESDMVIVDDLMYMAMDPREANLFFHLVNELYERNSIILTSNKAPDQWGELMNDQGITTAILNRLLHRAEVIPLHGDSYRIKHRESIF